MNVKNNPSLSFRINRLWQKYEWPVIIVLGFIAIILGYIGFDKHLAGTNEERSVPGILYRILQLFFVDSGFLEGINPPVGWELNVARFLAPLTITYTAFQALFVIFSEQINALRLMRINEHMIICGLGGKGQLIAKRLLEAGKRVVVIEQDEENDFVRQIKEDGGIVLFGNASDSELLLKAGTGRAKYLICVCGDDAINTEIAVHAKEISKNRNSGKLTCITHIFDPQLYELLSKYENIKSTNSSSFVLDFFNIYENGAQALLKEHPATQNILIVGFGRMGRKLLWNIANQCSDNVVQRQVLVIDRDATDKVESWRTEYPHLDKLCQIRPFTMDVTTYEYEKAGFLFNDEGKCVIGKIYICFDDDSFGLTAALKLHRLLLQNGVQIIVRMNNDFGLANLLHGTTHKGFENLYAFGLLSHINITDQILGDVRKITD